MHIPLTPEANLHNCESRPRRTEPEMDPLDQFLGLDVVHSMHTRNAITIITWQSALSNVSSSSQPSPERRTQQTRHVQSRQARLPLEHPVFSVQGSKTLQLGRLLHQRHNHELASPQRQQLQVRNVEPTAEHQVSPGPGHRSHEWLRRFGSSSMLALRELVVVDSSLERAWKDG